MFVDKDEGISCLISTKKWFIKSRKHHVCVCGGGGGGGGHKVANLLKTILQHVS